MSEQTNVQLVRHAYESVANRYMQKFLDLLHPEVEWKLPKMENVPFAGIWRGHEQVLRFMTLIAETQEVVEFKPDEFIAQNNDVVVLGHFFMRVRATGRDSISDWAHYWTVKNGKVTQFREYVDTAAVSKAHDPRLADESRSSLASK
jgi:ketosteroid isomerase-like protein